MSDSDSYHISVDLTPAPADYRASDITVSGYNMPPAASASASPAPLQATSLGDGVIRLFRDLADPPAPAVVHAADDTMVSIIAVPAYYTATDVLGFVGDHYMEHITHLRILRSDKPNRFLLLLKFSDAVKAAQFQLHYDGKPFNSMEPETCHVVFVRSVSVEGAAADTPPPDTLLPFRVADPFTSATAPTELPTCPVCLERLDHEVSGLLTIPCQHTFHCHCLSRWRDDTCPVCRYTAGASRQQVRRSVRRLSLINSRMQTGPPADAAERCAGCATASNLWVCLVCGHLGCSRYAPEQHSLRHFVDTGHCFAMELDSSRVWDYAGDNYVHRLITNGADGKIVEFPEKPAKSKDASAGAEYSELLLSQLVSQREYYENLLRETHAGSGMRTRRGSAVEPAAARRMAEMEATVGDLTDKLGQLTTSMQRTIDGKQTALAAAAAEVAELRALNDGLSEKVEFLAAENGRLRAETEDLGEQVKDLMFYLESQAKFKDQPADVREGTVVMRPKKGKR